MTTSPTPPASPSPPTPAPSTKPPTSGSSTTPPKSPTPAPLSPDQIARVDAAIAEAEKNTSGEIIAVVAGRSSVYWHAPYEAGLWSAGIAIVLATAVGLIVEHKFPEWH